MLVFSSRTGYRRGKMVHSGNTPKWLLISVFNFCFYENYGYLIIIMLNSRLCMHKSTGLRLLEEHMGLITGRKKNALCRIVRVFFFKSYLRVKKRKENKEWKTVAYCFSWRASCRWREESQAGTSGYFRSLQQGVIKESKLLRLLLLSNLNYCPLYLLCTTVWETQNTNHFISGFCSDYSAITVFLSCFGTQNSFISLLSHRIQLYAYSCLPLTTWCSE